MFLQTYILLLAQTAPPEVSLMDKWIKGEGGVLGLSLILNVILFNVAWYLLRLVIKKETEKNVLLERFAKDVLDNVVEVTKAITELSTIIKGQQR